MDRIPDERDQRRHLVWLTARGREIASTARRVLDPERLAAAFERLEERERRQLLAGMRALIRAAHELRTDPEPESEE